MKVPATIIDKKQETSSIITLRLDLGGQDFKFLAGQWVDCYVDIGGPTGSRRVFHDLFPSCLRDH